MKKAQKSIEALKRKIAREDRAARFQPDNSKHSPTCHDGIHCWSGEEPPTDDLLCRCGKVPWKDYSWENN